MNSLNLESLKPLYSEIIDPNCISKKSLFIQIYEMKRELLNVPGTPYFCTKCQKVHLRGAKLEEDRSFATLLLKYPPLRKKSFHRKIRFEVSSIIEEEQIELVNKSGNIVQCIKNREESRFKFQTIDDKGLHYVVEHNLPIEIDTDILSYGRVSETRWDRYDNDYYSTIEVAPRTKIWISFLDHYQIYKMLLNCQELVQLGYPQKKIIRFLHKFDEDVRQICFDFIQNLKNSEFENLSFVLTYFNNIDDLIEPFIDYDLVYQITKLEIEYEELYNSFTNIFLDHKASRMQKISELIRNIMILKQEKYYCDICSISHAPDDPSYLNHLHSAKISHKFPPIPYEPCEIELHTKIVGIYYTNNGKLIKSLPPKTEMTLKAEPFNIYDNQAVSVWYKQEKCGYIPQKENPPIFHALQSQQKVICILGNYHPKRDAIRIYENWGRSRYKYDNAEEEEPEYYEIQSFRPERADLTINIIDIEKIKRIFNMLVEYAHLNYPNLEQGFEKLGPQAFYYLNWYCNSVSGPETRKLFLLISKYFEIPLSNEELCVLL